MNDKPVLDAIRSILRFRDDTSIPEIATMAGVPRRHVLDTINANGHMVWRNKKTGRVARVDTTTPLRKQLWESGEFYRQGTYGAWSVEGHCLEFTGHEGLRNEIASRRTIGGLGDSSTIRIVEDTPENRAALESAGMRPWDEAVIDDRLWSEAAK